MGPGNDLRIFGANRAVESALFSKQSDPRPCVHPSFSHPGEAAWPPGQPFHRRPAGSYRSSCCAPAPLCRLCSEYTPSSSNRPSERVRKFWTTQKKFTSRKTTCKSYRVSIHGGGGFWLQTMDPNALAAHWNPSPGEEYPLVIANPQKGSFTTSGV